MKQIKHFLCRILATWVLCLAPSLTDSGFSVLAADNEPQMFGYCIYRDSWGNSWDKIGLYAIPLDGSAATPVFLNSHKVPKCAVYVDGKYYTVTKMSSVYGTEVDNTVYDATTWEVLRSNEYGGEVTTVADDFAYDPTTGKVYGNFEDGKGGRALGIYNLETFKCEQIAALNRQWNGCGITLDGELYAVGYDGNLYNVDKTTGAERKVGSTGLAPKYESSATVDPKTGKFYYALNNDSQSAIYEIDVNTAKATKIVSFDDYDEYVGLFILPPAAADDAPAEAEALATHFEAGSLDGTFAFKVPSLTYAGEPLSGELAYTVSVDGEVRATGNTQPGATVEVALQFSEAGIKEFSVVLVNEAGNSPAATLKKYVGHDVPSAVKGLQLSYDNGFNLVWQASTEGAHGGYLDEQEVRYRVMRYPGAVKVAEDCVETAFTDAFIAEDFAHYYYTVTPWTVHGEGESTISDTLTLGTIVPPYSNDFANESDFQGYTQFNANDDGRKWEWIGGEVRIGYNWSNAIDAWLFTPGIRLQRGKSYELSFNAAGSSAYYPECIEAYMGTDATAEAMKVQIVEQTFLASSDRVAFKARFTPEEDGVYYLGIHACRVIKNYFLYIDDIAVAEGNSTEAPAAPESLEALPDMNGELSATVRFVCPTLTIGGDELQQISYVEVSRGGKVLHRFDTPAPGESLEYVDAMALEGENKYTILPYNEAGFGAAAEVSAFVGLTVPAAVSDLSAHETETTGEVTVTWTAPTLDLNGKNLKPEDLTYTIVDEKKQTLVEGLTETSYTYQAVTADEVQAFKYYRVLVSNGKGTNPDAPYTNIIPVGAAYTLPFAEHFKGGNMDDGHIWSYERPETSTALWTLVTEDNSGIPAADGDKGYIGCKGSLKLDEATLYSGKISMETATEPVLTFLYYGWNDSENVAVAEVNAGNGFEALYDVTASGNDEWVKVYVPLKEYAGKQVQVGLDVIVSNRVYTLVDAIEISETPSFPAVKAIDCERESDGVRLKWAAPEGYTATRGLTLLGYNVYRDGKKVNEDLLAEPECFANHDGTAAYAVTVVYDLGESEASDPLSVTILGIENAEVDAVEVTVQDGALCVSGADGMSITVHDAAGRLISSDVCGAAYRQQLVAGAYLVTVAERTIKVVVE